MTEPCSPDDTWPNLEQHECALRENVLRTHRWPHLELLLDDIKSLAAVANDRHWHVLLMERTGLYGGVSLFAPYFKTVKSIDRSPNPIDSGYNAHLIDDRIIRNVSQNSMPWGTLLDFDGSVKDNSKAINPDLVIVPNLLHHVPDPFVFLDELRDCADRVYIFDVALEEIHQAPNHWGFFTHYGIQTQLQKRGFHIERVKTTGNAATVARYFLNNLWEHSYRDGGGYKGFVEGRDWLKRAMDDLSGSENMEPKNLERDRTETIMAWSVYASKL